MGPRMGARSPDASTQWSAMRLRRSSTNIYTIQAFCSLWSGSKCAWMMPLMELPCLMDCQWARLQKGGVIARAILIEAAALWLYSKRRDSRVPDDERLTYAIGTAVLHLAPRNSRTAWVTGRPSAGVRKDAARFR